MPPKGGTPNPKPSVSDAAIHLLLGDVHGEGWGEGDLTFPNSALCTPHLEEGEFGLTLIPAYQLF